MSSPVSVSKGLKSIRAFTSYIGAATATRLRSQPDTSSFVSASAILQQLHDSAPKDHFTIRWVMDQLQHQSFSVMLLMFAIAGLAPGIGTFAGLLTGITTFQMTIGRAAPFFPRLIVDHLLPVRHLHRMVPYAITALRFIERQIHPRWPGLIRVARLPIGIVVILLSVLLIVLPIPFSNLAPAFCIAMISLAYLEQDGVVLAVSLIVGLTIVWLNSALVWDLIWGAH